MECRKLDVRIKVYFMKEFVNEKLGTTEQSPELLKTVWANVQPRTGSILNGREAGTMLSKTTHAVTIRTNKIRGITDSCWIEWTDSDGGQHRFDIDYILPPNKNIFSTIYCTEVVRHGI